MKTRQAIALFAATIPFIGCGQRYREDLDYSYAVEQTWRLDDYAFAAVTQFEGVPFHPARTESLRVMVTEDQIAANRKVLQIGTGTGLLAILCMLHEANAVVATDRSPAAVSNAHYNAAELAANDKLDARLRPGSRQDAFSGLEATETFDLILVDLDYQANQPGQNMDDFIETLLAGLKQRLTAGGRCLVLCGNRPTIQLIQAKATQSGCHVTTDDDREWGTLETDFTPSMIWEWRASE